MLKRGAASLKARGRGLRRKAYSYWLRASYRIMWPVCLWLCGQGWFQRRHAETTDMLRRFLAALDTPPERLESALRQSLTQALWRERWFHIRWQTSEQLRQVLGLEHLRAAMAQGQGVVLAGCHQTFAKLELRWLAENGFAPAHIIASWRRQQPEAVSNPLLQLMKSAQDIQTAAECLQQGRIVFVLPDGNKGQRSLTMPACGRLRGFQMTFAELALRHGAPIVATALAIDEAGRLTLIFKPPFTVPQAAHNEQVASLVGQYAAHLEEHWRASPSLVSRRRIELYLEFPSA